VSRYFAELAQCFELGFDPGQSLPADDRELRPPAGAFLVARLQGECVGCGAVKGIAPGVGSIKRVWVDGAARGRGVGRRLLAALETEAQGLGLSTVRLETNCSLREAIRLYRTSGYAEVPPFNADPYADHWFEKELPTAPLRDRAAPSACSSHSRSDR
jgi:ribosomal protein S18 acetylase RimI-like enzyme